MSNLVDNLEQHFNAEFTKKLLVRYFSDKGYSENFDKRVYPPMLQDMIQMVPELFGKIEVEAYSKNIDPQTGWTLLGWNLFVLGNQRMYLGETEHTDIKELARMMEEGYNISTLSPDLFTSRHERTPREITNFVIRVLKSCDEGMIRHAQDPSKVTEGPNSASAQTGNMFERPKTARPEGRA